MLNSSAINYNIFNIRRYTMYRYTSLKLKYTIFFFKLNFTNNIIYKEMQAWKTLTNRLVNIGLLAVLICRQTHYQVARDKIKAKSFVQNNCMLMVNFIKGKWLGLCVKKQKVTTHQQCLCPICVCANKKSGIISLFLPFVYLYRRIHSIYFKIWS